jgi:hypothetical protein
MLDRGTPKRLPVRQSTGYAKLPPSTWRTTSGTDLAAAGELRHIAPRVAVAGANIIGICREVNRGLVVWSVDCRGNVSPVSPFLFAVLESVTQTHQESQRNQ